MNDALTPAERATVADGKEYCGAHGFHSKVLAIIARLCALYCAECGHAKDAHYEDGSSFCGGHCHIDIGSFCGACLDSHDGLDHMHGFKAREQGPA